MSIALLCDYCVINNYCIHSKLSYIIEHNLTSMQLFFTINVNLIQLLFFHKS